MIMPGRFANLFILLTVLLSLAFCPLNAQAAVDGYILEELTEMYSAQEMKFLQWFSDGYYFKTSVPNGQDTPGVVNAEIPEGLEWSLEYNGVYMEYSSGDYLFEPGEYRLTVFSPGGICGVFAFTITAPEIPADITQRAQTVVLAHEYTGGEYVFTFENGRGFSSNIPNGAITDESVTLSVDDAMIYIIIRDGVMLSNEPGEVFDEDGYYFARIISPMVIEAPDLSRFTDTAPGFNDSDADMDELARQAESYLFDESYLTSLEPGSVYQASFSFQIITRPTRDVPVFNVPVGFEIGGILLDGGEVTPSGVYSHRFTRDGKYTITLKDTASGAPDYVCGLTVLRSPPAVKLEGVTKGYTASGPVKVSAPDGVTLTVLRNNAQTVLLDTYTNRGRYHITAEDAAGNTSVVEFEIAFSLPRNLVLGGILILLAAGIGYIIYSKRSMVV